MFKRYKWLMIKVLVYFLEIVMWTCITTLIVEHRLANSGRIRVSADMDKNPFTPAFIPLGGRPTKKHVPRSPVLEPSTIKPITIKEREMKAARLAIPEAVGEKKDWENYALIDEESKRVGLGEQGKEAYILDESLKELEKKMFAENDINALLSDMMSVNRSVRDMRRPACRSKQYLVNLPSISVVIPFFNEHLSILLRALHSIVNRTPAELLHEIIIVDDGSDREDLKTKLDDYVQKNFPGIVTIVRLPTRSGLIVARLAGIRQATADVLVFFDAHVECTRNWLPPLLEPIALNPKICTCPTIDFIDHTTLAHHQNTECLRGAFNWNMLYHQLKPLQRLPGMEDTAPCDDPIMMGGLFAINRDFFWELGGYDEGLEVWGGEQYELSFKIWMCGGMVLDVPCSHVSHIFRKVTKDRPNPKKYNYLVKNYKRVAEVWMDEYKQYVYASNPEVYNAVDPGDLTALHENRRRLKCKPFKWFLEEVAPDLLRVFPPVPISFASGAVQSVAYPQYCLDTYVQFKTGPVKLYECAKNKTHPQPTQYWTLTHLRELRNKQNGRCLDVYGSKANETIWMWGCHFQEGNQLWYYDRQQQWLVHGLHGTRCMEAMVDGDKLEVYVNPCNSSNLRMKWQFGTVNNTALDAFFEGLDV